MIKSLKVLSEHHSKEVQEIISNSPPWLIRAGVPMIFCLVILLAIGTWWIKYPDIINVPITIIADSATPAPKVLSQSSNDQGDISGGSEVVNLITFYTDFEGVIQIPEINIGKLKRGQSVSIKLDEFPHQKYGLFQGTLYEIVYKSYKNGTYIGNIKLSRKKEKIAGENFYYKDGLKGQASIVLGDKRMFETLFSDFMDENKFFNDRSW